MLEETPRFDRKFWCENTRPNATHFLWVNTPASYKSNFVQSKMDQTRPTLVKFSEALSNVDKGKKQGEHPISGRSLQYGPLRRGPTLFSAFVLLARPILTANWKIFGHSPRECSARGEDEGGDLQKLPKEHLTTKGGPAVLVGPNWANDCSKNGANRALPFEARHSEESVIQR